MRILLFLATNFAILLVAGTVLSLLGFDSIMAANGVDLNLSALLVFCGVFGFSGSLISLFLSSTPAMVGALQRLRSEQALQQELPGELTAFGISEQMKEGVSRLFSSHPPLEERIRALQNAA